MTNCLVVGPHAKDGAELDASVAAGKFNLGGEVVFIEHDEEGSEVVIPDDNPVQWQHLPH